MIDVDNDGLDRIIVRESEASIEMGTRMQVQHEICGVEATIADQGSTDLDRAYLQPQVANGGRQ